MKRTLCALLCMLLLTSSCGSTSEPVKESTDPAAQNDTATESEETTETVLTAALPEVNYDGYAFTILTLKDYSRRYHLTADETSGEPLNDATYERNNKIYDRLGVEITTHEDDSTAAALQNAVASGDTTYSMVLPHPNAEVGLLKMVSLGLLYNQNELPIVDWSKPWWNDNARQTLSIKDTAYLASGDYSLTCQGMQGILFNKELMTNLGITANLYTLVREGKWTMDAFLPLVETAPVDLNGDGKMTADDRFAFCRTTSATAGRSRWASPLPRRTRTDTRAPR